MVLQRSLAYRFAPSFPLKPLPHSLLRYRVSCCDLGFLQPYFHPGYKFPIPVDAKCLLAQPLTDTKVKSAKPKGKTYTLADGGGMFPEIAPTGRKLWRMAYRQENGKSNRLTFGSCPEVSLAEARLKRAAARKQLSDLVDPAAHRREAKKRRKCCRSHV